MSPAIRSGKSRRSLDAEFRLPGERREWLLSKMRQAAMGRFFAVHRLLWAHGMHLIQLHCHSMVTASGKLLAAAHLQRVVQCDLADDSCAV
jgi:hypothetical protein